MAKQKVTAVEHTFTAGERAKYARAQEVITECQLKAEGLAERIAGQLYIVNKLNLYRIDDYTSMGDWASDKFGISKGTCSDAISTFDRFGNKEHAGQLADKYAEYTFSTLIKMKKLTDEQIAAAGINPAMSRAAVVKAIESLKAIEEKEARRPKLFEECNTLTAAFHKLVNDKQAVIDVVQHAAPEFFVKDHVATVDELEAVKEAIIKAIDDFGKTQAPEAQEDTTPQGDKIASLETPVDTTYEEAREEMHQAIVNNREELEEHLATANEDTESSRVENDTESSTVENEEAPEPPITLAPAVTLSNFMRENGTIDKKAYLAAVWEATQELINGADMLTIVRE